MMILVSITYKQLKSGISSLILVRSEMKPWTLESIFNDPTPEIKTVALIIMIFCFTNGGGPLPISDPFNRINTKEFVIFQTKFLAMISLKTSGKYWRKTYSTKEKPMWITKVNQPTPIIGE